MLLYRIGKTQYAHDLSGTGAKLNGGRWNHEGTPCIYAAASRALALLEFSTHVSLDLIPRALSFITLDLPDEPLLRPAIGSLPGNWNAWPYGCESRDMGTALLLQKDYLLVQLPSAVLPAEYNFLVNPLHPAFEAVRVKAVEDYAYDLRVKQ